MAGVNQTSEGTWRIVDLCTHETENVYNLSIPIKLTYGGKSVETNISNTKKSLATEWKTALGTAINTNQISLSSGTATYGSTIYKINKINWGTVKPYEKPDSFTYSLVVSGASYAAASYNDSLTFGAWYKTFNNGTLVNTENVTSNANCTWSVDKTALVSSINNGNVTFNNTGSTDTTIKITATYNGYTDNVDVTVPKKSDEPVQTYTLSFSGNVTGASIEVSGDKTYTYTGGTLVTEGQYVKNQTVSYTITKDGYDTINDSVKITGNTLEKFEMSESEPEPPQPTYEYKVVVEPSSTASTSYTGTQQFNAFYVTMNGSTEIFREDVTETAEWSNSQEFGVNVSINKGLVTFENTLSSQHIVTINATYEGKSGSGQLRIASQQHTLTVQPETYLADSPSGVKDFVAYFDSVDVTSDCTWDMLTNPLGNNATLNKGTLTYNNTSSEGTGKTIEFVVKYTHQGVEYTKNVTAGIPAITVTEIAIVPVYSSVTMSNDNVSARLGYQVSNYNVDGGYKSISFSSTADSTKYSYQVLDTISTSATSLTIGITVPIVEPNKDAGATYQVYATKIGRTGDTQFIEDGYFTNTEQANYSKYLGTLSSGSFTYTSGGEDGSFGSGSLTIDFNEIWEDPNLNMQEGDGIAIFFIITAVKSWSFEENFKYSNFTLNNTSNGDTDFTANTFDFQFRLENNTSKAIENLYGIKVYLWVPYGTTAITFKDEVKYELPTGFGLAGYFTGSTSFPIDVNELNGRVNLPANTVKQYGKYDGDGKYFNFSDYMTSNISGVSEAAAFYQAGGAMHITCVSENITYNNPITIRPTKRNN